jgi:hypothetical protein
MVRTIGPVTQGCGSVSVVLPSLLLRPGTLPDQERKIHLTQLFRFLGPPLPTIGSFAKSCIHFRARLVVFKDLKNSD